MSTVREEVLRDLQAQKHVRPVLYMDSELPYLTSEEVPGVPQYREQVKAALNGRAITEMPHAQIIAKVDEAGKIFHVLVLKTTLTMPYTSLFLQLDCKYWSAASEAKLRAAMLAPQATGEKAGAVR